MRRDAKKPLFLRIAPETDEELRTAADVMRVTTTAVIELALAEYFRNNPMLLSGQYRPCITPLRP